MADKNANIDLLFRNGLKDYEVLPPPEVWNNIVPVIRRKQKTYVILRAAALVAVLVSLSIYAYRWSREVIIQMQNPEVALNEGSTQNRNNNVDKKPAGKSSLLSRQISKTRALPSDLFETETTIATAPSIEAEAETEAGPALAHLPDAIIVFPESALNPQANLIKQEKLFDTQNNSTVIQKPDVIKKPETQADDAYDIFKGNNGNLTGIEYKAPNTKKGKITITASVTPTYYVSHEGTSDEGNGLFGLSEQSMISFSGGVSLSYKLGKKLSVQSGLFYSSVENQIEGIASYTGFRRYDYSKGTDNFEVITSNGNILTENADVFLIDRAGDRVITVYSNDVFDPDKANLTYADNALYQNFSYMEIPVFLRYKLIDKTLGVNIIGGVSYNILVNNTVNAHVDGSKYYIGKTDGLSSFIVSSSIGMGLEYSISKRISLNLEPTFRYYLSPFNEMVGTREHPYSFGVFSGLSFKF